MRIAVLGANGQLGSDVVRAFREAGDEVNELNHDAVEVADAESVARVLDACRPEMVVDTAAYHHVERCEANPELAFRVNALGAHNVGRVVHAVGAYLVYVSTDYVFDGRKRTAYVETDPPGPLNVYGNTKLSGEYFVLASGARAAVLRTSGLYGRSPCRAKGHNFVELMLKLARERDGLRVVDNEVLTPTSTREVARQILALSRSPVVGVCHATAEGSCSWYAFAREIFALSGLTVNLAIAAPGEFPAKVPRPEYSVLENQVLKRHGVNVFKSWQEGLREYLLTRNEAKP